MDIKPSTVSSNLASCAGNPFSCLLIGAFFVIVGYPAGQCPVPHCLLRLHSLTSHFASHRTPALGRSRTTTAWTLWLRHFREYVSWEMYTRVLLDSVQPAILYCFHFVFRCHIGQNKNVNGCIAGWAVRGLDRQEGIFGLISPATLILFLYWYVPAAMLHF